MDRLREELEDAKAEIEKLKAEYRSKAEQSECLKRSHNEQLGKIQAMSSKLEKQARELSEKADEVSITKQMYEGLECNLKEKESIIKHLSYTNDKLRVDSQEKLKKCEEEKGELIFAMEEGTTKNLELEEKIHSLKEENEFLKGRIFVLQKVGVEAKETAKVSKELRQRDEVLVKFEEEKKKVEEELKWKKEQFKHLEEAHEKLRGRLKSKERGWEKEKCALIDEISTVQTNLDSQMKISEGLKSRLEMCNQALAHEESRRRNLEAKISGSTTCFENTFAECEEVKSNLKSLTGQRDKEIAALRDLMGTKESDYKEMEYRLRKVEKENEELKVSLKELHEDQIQEARACSPMYKPRSKTKSKSSENIHKECLNKLKAKEDEWGSQMEKMGEELSSCRFELKGKDEFINELKLELENCDASIMELSMKNEEASVMSLVLKSVFMETRIKIADEKAKMEKMMGKMREELSSCRFELKGKDEFINELKLELENCDSSIMELSMKNEESYVMSLVLKSAFVETRMKLADEKAKMDLKREENSLLSLLHKEVDGYKENMLKMTREYQQVCDAFDRANEELAQEFIEGNEVEFELQLWKSIAERLKSDLEENYQTRRDMEASLLEQVSVEVNLKEENKSLVNALEQRDGRIDDLQRLVGLLQQHAGDSLEKIKTAEVMKEIEIQENRLIFQELEKDLRNLEKKLEAKSFSGSKEKRNEIEGKLEVKELEVKKLTHFIGELFDNISKVSNEDVELMGQLGRIVGTCDENLEEGEELFESEKENANIQNFIAMKKPDAYLDGRSPLRALNT